MRSSDKQAFEDFTTVRGPALSRTAYLLTGDRDRAAALVERALADTYRSWARLDPDTADGYARRALLAALLGHRRPRPTRRDRPEGPQALGAGPAAPVAPVAPAAQVTGPTVAPGAASEVVTDADAVWRALGSLPPRRRAVLVLRYDGRCSDAAIAALLGTSPAAVSGEADAALAGLGRILRRRGRPEDLLPAALGRAVGEGSEPLPTAPPVAASASSATAPPVAPAASSALAPATPSASAVAVVPTLEQVRRRVRRGRRRPLLVVIVVLLVAAAVIAAVALPSWGEAGRSDGPVPGAGPQAPHLGLLAWPARGGRVNDRALLRSALRAWKNGVGADDQPVRSAAVLYAGDLDGRRVVLLQALDPTGVARVAEVAGASGKVRLVRAEPLGQAVPLLAVASAGAGPAGQLRVLVPPPTVVPNPTLLVGDPAGTASAVAQVQVDGDGLSGSLTQTSAGAPLQVVLLQTASTTAASGAGTAAPRAGSASATEVVGSGEVAADRIVSVTGQAEIGAPQLTAGGPSVPTATTLQDAQVLAQSLGKAVVVAALGPTIQVGELTSSAYEVRWADGHWVGYVARRDGRVLCAQTVAVALTPLARSAGAMVLRCRTHPGVSGILHVVARPGVAAVRVSLAAGGAGQPPYQRRFARPGTATGTATGTGADRGFSILTTVNDAVATGAGTVEALDAKNRVVGRWTLAADRRR